MCREEDHAKEARGDEAGPDPTGEHPVQRGEGHERDGEEGGIDVPAAGGLVGVALLEERPCGLVKMDEVLVLDLLEIVTEPRASQDGEHHADRDEEPAGDARAMGLSEERE